MTIIALCLFVLVAGLSFVLAKIAKELREAQVDARVLLSRNQEQFRAIEELTAQADIRNTYLNFALRYAILHVADPYVIRPGYDEPRCYHCYYPKMARHASDCPWVHCRPLTEVLYPPPPPTTLSDIAAQTDMVFPQPDEFDEDEK